MPRNRLPRDPEERAAAIEAAVLCLIAPYDRRTDGARAAAIAEVRPRIDAAERVFKSLEIAGEVLAGPLRAHLVHAFAAEAPLHPLAVNPIAALLGRIVDLTLVEAEQVYDDLAAYHNERTQARALLIGGPRTPLALVRRALHEGGSSVIWNQAATRDDACRDPEIRTLLSRSGNPHVVLALTLTAPPDEQQAWLARLGTQHPLVASRALARGQLAGLSLPQNFMAGLLASARDDVRLTAMQHLGTVDLADAVEPTRRAPGRQRSYAPNAR